jgi:pimeloyl-ACP methyl ester carboxylesterase
MPAIAVRDTTIYYEQAGRGPALLFIHGMCGDAAVWAGQVRRLAGRFCCVTYDRRGHTRSGPGTEPESVATHAADAAALIEALGLARPVAVGSSGGARIAVELARTRPGLLAGAVLSEPPILSLDPAGQAFMAEIAAAVRPAAQAGGPAAAVDAFFPLVCPGLWSRLDETAKDRYRANGPMMLAEFAGPPYQPAPGDLAGTTLPCLVIAGTESHPAPRAIAKALARALPDSRLIELAGSGHVTYAERPDQFAQAVAVFATQVTSPQPSTATRTCGSPAISGRPPRPSG